MSHDTRPTLNQASMLISAHSAYVRALDAFDTGNVSATPTDPSVLLLQARQMLDADRAERQAAHEQRQQTPIATPFGDLDRRKTYNVTYTHKARGSWSGKIIETTTKVLRGVRILNWSMDMGGHGWSEWAYVASGTVRRLRGFDDTVTAVEEVKP